MGEFKNSYIAFLATGSLLLVYIQRDSIFGKNPTSVDLLLIAIAVACLLLPIVSEVSIGGLTLKKEIEETKKEITERLSQIKNEIVSSIAVSPTFNFNPYPLNDEALKKLEENFEQTVNDAFQSFAKPGSEISSTMSVEDETLFLFSARHNIEKELRRIWGNRDFKDSRWPTTVSYMTKKLSAADIIPNDFVHAIKEVYNVCSPAIHGEDVTQQQIEFVQDLAPKIVATLKSID